MPLTVPLPARISPERTPAQIERRRSSEEYAAAMRLHAFSEINQMLAKRNAEREKQLRDDFEAKRAAKNKPSERPVFRSVLSSPSAVYPVGLRPTGPSAFDSMEEIPLVGIARRRSTPGVITLPNISPTQTMGTPRGGRTPRHYFDLTPGGSQRSSPNGDQFTPMQAPATVVEPEVAGIKERIALGVLVLGMAAIAVPIIIVVVKAIQHNIEKLRGN